VEWGSERAWAVFEALDGAFAGDGIVVAVTAVDSGSGPAFAVTGGLPEEARFEVGSITKTMTAALLVGLAGDGALALDDEIGRWLDAGPNGSITLEQLTTHTSGLPRLAPGQPAGDAYRDFSAERAEERLRTTTRAPGTGHLYSNFGYQLLGLALERASGQRYQDLLAQRLLGPLGMTRTGACAAGGGTRLTGHAGGKPAGMPCCPARAAWRRPSATWRATWPPAWPRQRARSAPRSGCASSRACASTGSRRAGWPGPSPAGCCSTTAKPAGSRRPWRSTRPPATAWPRW
jgi:CubicO group peptidase (beta-lactamase class C family)